MQSLFTTLTPGLGTKTPKQQIKFVINPYDEA